MITRRAEVENEHIGVTTDLANGMILTLLKNVRLEAPPKTAEMLAYSRSQGLFAGINLSGGVLRPD